MRSLVRWGLRASGISGAMSGRDEMDELRSRFYSRPAGSPHSTVRSIKPVETQRAFLVHHSKVQFTLGDQVVEVVLAGQRRNTPFIEDAHVTGGLEPFLPAQHGRAGVNGHGAVFPRLHQHVPVRYHTETAPIPVDVLRIDEKVRVPRRRRGNPSTQTAPIRLLGPNGNKRIVVFDAKYVNTTSSRSH